MEEAELASPEGTIFDLRNLEGRNCFLCGSTLTDDIETVEHVIPKWLQGDMCLWNQTIYLQNHTPLPYSKLTIPCCKNCNGGPLSSLENEIRMGMKGGHRRLRSISEERVWQWCAKLYYGLLYRELSLAVSRRDPMLGSITTPAFLRNLSTFHIFLQSIRLPFTFHEFTPHSVFIFETLAFQDNNKDFDYIDTLAIGPPELRKTSLHFALRCKDVGIICVFQDNGRRKALFQCYLDKFEGIPMHPLQFAELVAKSAYKHSLLRCSPKYTISTTAGREGPCHVFAHAPIAGSLWDEWNNNTYAHLFSVILKNHGVGLSPERVYDGPYHHSYLLGEAGIPRRWGRDFDPFDGG